MTDATQDLIEAVRRWRWAIQEPNGVYDAEQALLRALEQYESVNLIGQDHAAPHPADQRAAPGGTSQTVGAS